MSASDKTISSPSTVSIGAKITPAQSMQIRELIEAGAFINESDFVRDAIRHRLTEIKVVKCRDIDNDTARKEITGYFKRHGEAFPDEAAEDLELDFDLVMRIAEELRKDGTLEEA
jgi:Arc/MetJ-type ribon-helix-helix transcriptional regulator